jgi:hypothetical protein
MGVHVDKAGCDDQPRDIDLARTSRFCDLADRGDAAAGDRDIRPAARPAGAVDYRPTAQDPIANDTPPSCPRAILPVALGRTKSVAAWASSQLPERSK